MARQTYQQPITQAVNDLVIGVPGFRFRKIDNATAFGNTQADLVASPLTTTYSIGSLQSGSFSADASFNAHSSGYPKLEDARILEQTTVSATVVTEEIGSAQVQTLIQSAINRATGASPDRYACEMLFEKVYGGGVSFYQNNAQIRPELSISTQNDWIGLEMNFESLLNSSYTNQELAYRANYSGTARDYDNQALTIDPNSLCIGFAQVRMGAITPRPTTGGNGPIYDPRFYPAAGSTSLYSELVSNAGAAIYTGTDDGAFVIEITTVPYRVDGSLTGATFDTSTGTGDNTISVATDGGGAQAIVFTDSAVNTIAQCVIDLNAALTGSTAYADDDNHIYIMSDTGPTGTIEITESNTALGFIVAAPAATDLFTWTAPDGVVTAAVAITGAAQALGGAVTATFGKLVNFFYGDKWAIGVETGGLKDGDPAATSIHSPVSFLLESHTVGAVQAVTLGMTASLNPHYSGYPLKKDAEIAESVEIVLDISLEEFTFAAGALVYGAATTLADAIFDSSIAGNRYHAPFEMIIETLDGNVVSFWLPNCEIVGQLSISPSDSWGVLPFQAASQTQFDSYFDVTATAPRQLYLLTDDLYNA